MAAENHQRDLSIDKDSVPGYLAHPERNDRDPAC
jgi:hypothetical protein